MKIMRGKSIALIILVSLFVGTLSGGAAGIFAPYLVERGLFEPWISAPDAKIAMTREREVVSTDEERTKNIVESALPSVVSINITKEIARNELRVDQFEEFFNDPFFSFPVPEQLPDEEEEPEVERLQIGGGTGFFVTTDGIVATNRHVIEDEEAEYSVVLQNGDELKATVLALDPVLDLGFLKVEGGEFPSLQLGDSDGVEVGESVIAIGNALAEFSNSVTKGIVSGKDRRLLAGTFARSEIIEEAIQTDAAINPGNSGGPLIDLNGEVVGMNTAISDRAQLLGFALPSNSVKRALDSVKEHGRIVRPWLGVRFVPIDDEYAEANSLSYDHGAHVIFGDGETPSIIPDSPADRAGIEPGDIILSIDGEGISLDNSLANIIAKKFPGDEVTLRIARNGEEIEINVVLEERDPDF